MYRSVIKFIFFLVLAPLLLNAVETTDKLSNPP